MSTPNSFFRPLKPLFQMTYVDHNRVEKPKRRKRFNAEGYDHAMRLAEDHCRNIGTTLIDLTPVKQTTKRAAK